jgi:hypothetical protein
MKKSYVRRIFRQFGRRVLMWMGKGAAYAEAILLIEIFYAIGKC